MWLKKWLDKKITLTILQRQCMIIITLLLTLFLINVLPRFRNDAMSFPWYVYIALIILFSIPFIKK